MQNESGLADRMPSWRSFHDLPRAYGKAEATGRLRERPEDFRVDERLAFEPLGEGPHVYLRLLKRSTNTRWLADQIARLAGVRPETVGYAGLKDRHAETSQWFSVPVNEDREPDWSALESDEVRLLGQTRHQRKLRQDGGVRANQFDIRVRQFTGDRLASESRLESIRCAGVPNYFGGQRFGIEDGNLYAAVRMLGGARERADRFHRGIYLSAARSQLFNEVLAARVVAGTWDRVLEGEVLADGGGLVTLLGGAGREDGVHQTEPGLREPTGPMWGRGRSAARGEALEVEERALEPFASWRLGLEHVGLRQERRALRLMAQGLEWEWEDVDRSAGCALCLRFSLAPGGYATAVLREVCD